MTPRQQRLLNLVLALYALLTFARAVSNVAQPYGAGDLYVYWYAGHFMREQRNPYLAYLNDDVPSVPVAYLDGATFTKLPEPWIVPFSPVTNTSPYVLLLSLLANVNWYIAKWSFFIINLILAVSIPAIAFKTFHIDWPFPDKITTHLLFFATIGSRTTLVNSQNSLLFLLIMLLTFAVFTSTHHAPRTTQPWLIAILFGLTLSKISLAISLCILLVLLRRWFPLIIAALVQLIGLLMLGLWTQSSPLDTLNAHWQIFNSVAAFDGIHLAHLIPSATPFILIGTIALFAWLFWLAFQNRLQQPIHILQITLCILAVWSLLFAYHGPYDAVLLLPVYLILLNQLRHHDWPLTRKQTQIVYVFLSIGCIILLLPGNIDFLNYLSTPSWWPHLLPKLIAAHMFALLTFLILLLQKSLRPLRFSQ